MIIATNTGAVIATQDNIRELERILDELAALYAHNEWTWSGDPVTRHMIEWRLCDLIMVAVDSASKKDDGYSAICAGRLRVEARNNPADSEDRYAILVEVQFSI